MLFEVPFYEGREEVLVLFLGDVELYDWGIAEVFVLVTVPLVGEVVVFLGTVVVLDEVVFAFG